MTAGARPDLSSVDILVVGAGPAGMAAAVRARESNARVLILDDNPAPGGQIWRGSQTAYKDPQSARWFNRLRDAAVPVLTGTQVISATAGSKTVLAETWDSVFEIRYKRLIIAAGAREIFLPFPGWTLPGIVGVGGLQALAKSGVPVQDKSVVIAGSGPLLLAVAANLRKLGTRITLIAEQTSRQSLMRFALGLIRHPSKLTQALTLQRSLIGVPYRKNCWVEAAEGTERVERLVVRQGGRRWKITCDYAAVGFGLYPNLELPLLLDCRIQNDAVAVDDYGRTSVTDVYCAGECTGVGGADLAILEGEIAGHSASGRDDLARRRFAARKVAQHFADRLSAAFALRSELKMLPQDNTLVCRCEDVSYGTLKSSPSFRAAKLHYRCGMGPCQARICGPATQFLFGWRAESIRPPIFPARLGSLAFDEAVQDEPAPTPP